MHGTQTCPETYSLGRQTDSVGHELFVNLFSSADRINNAGTGDRDPLKIQLDHWQRNNCEKERTHIYASLVESDPPPENERAG
jgi:hypothetical protein